MREELHLCGLHAGDLRGDELIAVAPDGDVAGRNRDGIERLRILRRSGPEQRCTVTEIAGSGQDHPDEYSEAGKPRAAQGKQSLVFNQAMTARHAASP